MKDQDPFGERWDYLVVLDACRYDAFAEQYGEHLDGTLQKRRSKGSATTEWAAKTFTGQYDVTYFSANPFINSLDVPLNELKWGTTYEYEWAAVDHFAEVVDVWRDAWDDDAGTVLPEDLNATVRSHLADGGSDGAIVHYMQPHAPYLPRGKGRKLAWIRDGIADDMRAQRGAAASAPAAALSRVADAVLSGVESLLVRSHLAGVLGVWADVRLRGLPNVWRLGTGRALRRYYEANLDRVLAAVADLVDGLDGRVVVTSDHGEAFGEQDVWEHEPETHIPELVEVPWLRVDG